MSTTKTSYWVAFSHLEKLNKNIWEILINNFDNLEQAWQANLKELTTKGISHKQAQYIIKKRNELNPDWLYQKTLVENLKICTILDKEYPLLLKQIYDPPYIFYYRGSLDALKCPCLSVVGSRKFTSYGKRVAEAIVCELAMAGMTIISGLALGIDGFAHQFTIDSGGKTVAVLGTGVDQNSVYPVSNRRLADKIIASGGALISEYPAGTVALPQNFPKRNRIIAGLSAGSLIIEAKEKSGTLITAYQAAEQNRSVFTIPGDIFTPAYGGNNSLLKKGAIPITKATDILEYFNLTDLNKQIKQQSFIPESEEEEIVYQCLSKEPTEIDKIIKLAKMQSHKTLSALTLLEVKGIIKNHGGKYYIK